MIDPLDAIMGAFTCPATVTVVDKPFFKNRGDVVENKVVDNPVTEIGGEINQKQIGQVWYPISPTPALRCLSMTTPRPSGAYQ